MASGVPSPNPPLPQGEGEEVRMSDNPFSEPDDSDRTVIRPVPGGRRATPPPQAPITRLPRVPRPPRAGCRADPGGRRGDASPSASTR